MSELTRYVGITRASSLVRKSALIWTTADGHNIAIEDMETKHLFCAMKMNFNHFASMWGGRPVWFTKQYSDYTNRAVSGPERLVTNVALMLRELDRRNDLPEIYRQPLAEIKAQIAAKTQALPQPSERVL